MSPEADNWSKLSQVNELVGLVASVDLQDLQLARLRETCDLRCWFFWRSFCDKTRALLDLLQVRFLGKEVLLLELDFFVTFFLLLLGEVMSVLVLVYFFRFWNLFILRL